MDPPFRVGRPVRIGEKSAPEHSYNRNPVVVVTCESKPYVVNLRSLMATLENQVPIYNHFTAASRLP